MTFREQVELFIIQKKMTKKQIAEKMGVSPGTLSDMLRGDPKISTAQRIADALDCELKIELIPKK